MWILNKIILVFTLFLINTFTAYGKSFQLICEFNKSTEYSFSRWGATHLNEKYLIIQNHLLIDNKAIFKQRNISTKQIKIFKNKKSWTYIDDDDDGSERELKYVYFDNTKKLNIEISGRVKGYWTAWSTCKKEPIDKATLAKYSQQNPSENNKIVSEYNKVLENKLQEVERKSKELENKLAALRSQKKEINQSIAEKKDIGSGFYVSKFRHIVTNQHVVNQCKKITVGDGISKQIPATIVASDKRNDLAILQTISMEMASADTKSFIQNLSIEIVPIVSGGLIRAEDVIGGEEIFVAGYPLGNMVSDSMRLVPGLVNATKGYENDITQFETDASIKKGNSGGPIYDKRGNIVGVAVKRLNVSQSDNFNFAIKGTTVKQFLDANGVITSLANRTSQMSSTDIYKIASKQTVMVICYK